MNVSRVLIAIAFCSIALLAGCTRPTHVDSSATPSLFYPPGIEPPGDWSAERKDGIYSSEDAKNCCFLAGHSTLTLRAPATATLVVFKMYVPDVKPLAPGERVSVSINGVPAGQPSLIPQGLHDVIFTIPPSVRKQRPLVATLAMSVAWVPNKIGLNADTRELSVVLLQVGYI